VQHVAALACLLGGCDLVFELPDPAPSGCPSSGKPVGMWHLDEVPGEDVARSALDDPRPATYEGDVMLGIPGAVGTAAAFHTTGHVLLGERFGFENRAPFSVEAWIQPDRDGMTFRHIVNKQQRTTKKVGWALILDTMGRAVFERYATDEDELSSPAQVVSTATFTHATGVYDGLALRLYLNGLEVGSGTPDLRDMETNDGPALIGAADIGGDSVFDGAIDEVAIFDRALTPDEILQHFEAGLDPACLAL
jgi:hypothetical protein